MGLPQPCLPQRSVTVVGRSEQTLDEVARAGIGEDHHDGGGLLRGGAFTGHRETGEQRRTR